MSILHQLAFLQVWGWTNSLEAALCLIWWVGCAGTPVQNSMEELFGIMNVLDPAIWDDEDEFLERFGKGMPTPEQVQELQVSPSAPYN